MWRDFVCRPYGRPGLKAALCGRCVSSERGVDNELEMGGDMDDAIIYRDKKHKDQLEVAIGDGMEFTIHGTTSTLYKLKIYITCDFLYFQSNKTLV